MKKKQKKSAPQITREQILQYIQTSNKPVGKRDILKAFRVRGADKDLLTYLIKELKKEGHLSSPTKFSKQSLPKTLIVKGIGLSKSGDRMAVPAQWHKDVPPPPIFIPKTGKTLDEGMTALIRLGPQHKGAYEGHVLRQITRGHAEQIYGLIRDGQFLATSRKFWYPFFVTESDVKGDLEGELVLAEITSQKRAPRQTVKVIEKLLPVNQRYYSEIAINEHEIPAVFSQAALEQAKEAKPVKASKQHEDLTQIPLVTIDGADARDFDDAVFAEPHGKGFHLIVAIADVSHYVTPKDALDEEAYMRGNSVYFPDQVVPMLPEELSNDLCSLRPHEIRPVLAVHLYINAQGILETYRFTRALIKSHARLTYEQVERAMQGETDELTKPLRDKVLMPLYQAYKLLELARENRGTLDLSFPEYKIQLDEKGHVTGINEYPRLDAHKVIEEFMITANVAAALEITKHDLPGVFRVHDHPTPEKLEHLRKLTDIFGLFFTPKGKKNATPTHEDFSKLIKRVENTPQSVLIQEGILKSQAQAVYSTENKGHYGLALTHYCHFTSPIRRYADLMVHRALISHIERKTYVPSLDFLDECAAHISATERRAQVAERETIQRYMAHYMAQFRGKIFEGRVSFLSFSGVFVRLANGTEGVVPLEDLPNDYYNIDGHSLKMTGHRTGQEFHLGQALTVEMREANPASGRIFLSMLESESTKKKKDKPEGVPKRRRIKKPGRAPEKKKRKKR